MVPRLSGTSPGSTDLRLSESLPAIEVDETIMFGHPTRLVDSWWSKPEHVLMPAYRLPEAELGVEVARGTTDRRDRLRAAIRHPLDLRRRARYLSARRLPVLDCGDELLYDIRWEVDANVAHVLLRAASALLARRAIEEQAGRPAPVVVVLRERASAVARWLLDRLEIPYRRTDHDLRGVLVRCESPYNYPVNNGRYLGGLALDLGAETPRRVFVSRRGSRVLLNDDEVAEHLARRGFERIYCEDLPFDRQQAILGNAEQVVGIHGAGLAWLGFNPRGTGPDDPPRSGIKFVELFGPGYIVDCYRVLMSCARASYAAVRGQITPEVVRDLDGRGDPRSHVNSPFRVDLGTLDLALDRVGA